MSQNVPLSQLPGPGSATTFYHESWAYEYIAFYRNLSLAFEWIPTKLPKDRRLHSNPIYLGISLPSLLKGENAKFNALLLEFFTHQIFTHVFGPHTFTSPIKQAFSRAQEFSKEDTARGKESKSYFSLGSSQIHDLIRDRTLTRDAARFRLYYELILPLITQHPLRHRARKHEVFKGFFDWLFDGETPSIGKLKCHLLFAASTKHEYLLN